MARLEALLEGDLGRAASGRLSELRVDCRAPKNLAVNVLFADTVWFWSVARCIHTCYNHTQNGQIGLPLFPIVAPVRC